MEAPTSIHSTAAIIDSVPSSLLVHCLEWHENAGPGDGAQLRGIHPPKKFMATRGYCMFARPTPVAPRAISGPVPVLSRFQCRRFALAEPPLNLLTTGVPLPNASDHRQTEAQGEMEILHVALAKLDKSLLKQSEEDTFKQIHLMLDGVPVPKHDVRVGPPLIPQSTRGYDIMLSIKFDKLEDFKAYLAHPKHIEILKVFGPSLQDMITYQVDGAASKSKL